MVALYNTRRGFLLLVGLAKKKSHRDMRRTVLLLAVMATALVLSAGVASARAVVIHHTTKGSSPFDFIIPKVYTCTGERIVFREGTFSSHYHVTKDNTGAFHVHQHDVNLAFNGRGGGEGGGRSPAQAIIRLAGELGTRRDFQHGHAKFHQEGQ